MEKYQLKSEIEHILDRSGMYMGSTNNEVTDLMLYKPSENKIIQVKNAVYNAGLQKLFDEILSNSVDEHRRKDSLFDLNHIEVSINKNGVISVRDNGGIPVDYHKETGILIPELIFGHLRTSSNYDDTQDRNVIGTNGLGSKLTNIFSKYFRVNICDGKKMVTCTWTENMRNLEISEITSVTPDYHWTEIIFQIDLERFDIQELDLSTIRQMQKRCIDACAVHPRLTIKFNSDIADGKLNSTWHFDSFNEYIKLYLEPEQFNSILNFKSNKFVFGMVPNALGYNIAFVNGALCCGGTHIKLLQNQITNKLIDFCKKNEMELITEKDINTRMTLFINCIIRNPTYDSQTKERLTNKLTTFDMKITESFFKELLDSEFIQVLKDFYSVKYAEEQKKETRKLNKLINSTKQSKKLILATGKSALKELWLFEGNSASNGFRKFRNPQTQSAYLLRGKIKNTFDLKKTQIVENQELREIIATLGLQFGKSKENIKNLKYDKIIVDTDSDYDGHHICGLFLAFITKHFPELIQHHKIFRALSPIIICVDVKTGDKNYFYTMEEFHQHQNEYNSKDFEIRYTKGLGGLEDADYEIMLRQQKLLEFDIQNQEDFDYIAIWFEKSAVERKKLLMDSDFNDSIYE